MKLEIFDKDTDKELTFLKLKAGTGCLEGGIDLCIVDSKGEVIDNGVILSITKDGNLYRRSNINKNCGLNLSKHGKIRCTDVLYEPKETIKTNKPDMTDWDNPNLKTKKLNKVL